MTSTEARAALPELLDRVSAGEEVTITRHGQPVAVVVRPDALRVRRADRAMAAAGRVRDALVAARDTPLSAGRSLSPQRAEEMVVEMRADRDRS